MSRRAWRFVLPLAAIWLVVLLLVVCLSQTAHAQELATPELVHAWISDYAQQDATPGYPYARLVADAERVAHCESIDFDAAVLNDARLGSRGEVGAFQFMTGPHSIFWITPSAAAGWDMWDPEANVAGAVWLISRGFGPRNWSCW